MGTPIRRTAVAVFAGVIGGGLLTLSPLGLAAAALAVLIVAVARRQLPEDERRTLTTILVLAMAVRVVVVWVWAVWSIPVASAQSGGVLLGDEAYVFERSLRTRDISLGAPVTKLDYMIVFDEYADTKYTEWVTWVQTWFGPSPFALRLVNGLLFVAGASVMYRLARSGFGPTAAQCALVLLLFLPSLLFWSVSLLKDSVYYLLTTVTIAAAVLAGRRLDRRPQLVASLTIFGAALWGLSDLRPWAVSLTAGGLLAGLFMFWIMRRRVRVASAAAALVLAGAIVLVSQPVSAAVLRGLTWGAQQHLGHAQTAGRSYRTLDSRFYGDFLQTLADKPMQPAEGVRYVARAAGAFVGIPLPWQALTTRELLFIPEQVVWYVTALFGILGLRAAYKRDPLLTSLLVGYIVTFSAALALINGNVGTLIRLRGLVSRFVVWIAAVGLMSAIAKVTSDKKTGAGKLVDGEGRLAGRINVIDALCVALVGGLVPLAYLSWLLFQPAAPVIRSVERSEVTSAEQRIAAGQPIRLKVKIRGEHLTPMLRPYVGTVPAMGFTFETPASGDVIIGENVPPGTHDLVLFDGLVEVARAKSAVTIVANAGVPIRAIGALTLLDEKTAQNLRVGQQFHIDGRRAAEILALGEAGPDRREIAFAVGSIQQQTADTWSREIVLATSCDPDPDPSRCRIGGVVLSGTAPAVVVVPGSSPAHRMRVDAVVPDAAPTTALVRIRFQGSLEVVNGLRAGDRDVRWPAIDERTARVERIEGTGRTGTVEAVVRLGIDRASDGWRYHSQRIAADTPFSFVTDRYSIVGTVSEMVIDAR